MASTKIRGITIELNADTAGILDSLKDLNKDLSATQRSLNDVNKLLKFDPDNVTLLAQKQEYLTDAVAKTEEKLRLQKEALEALRNADDAEKTIEQQKALEREIEATNQKLNTYQGELDQTGNALKGVGDETEKAGEGFKTTESAIEALAKSEAFSRITENSKKVAEALLACDAAADKFETSMAKVETLAHAGSGLSQMAQDIKNYSAAIGVSSTDMAEAVYQAMSAGVASGEAIEFAAEASKLAIAGFTDTATAVDIVTTALNAYDLEMTDSTHILDSLITTQNLGKTTVSELASSMGKVIPVASAYSVNMDNLASAYAELTAKGISTRIATTDLAAMFKELGDEEKVVNEILYEMTGQTFGQFMSSGKSLGDAMNILWEAAGKDKEAFQALWSQSTAATAAFNLASDGGEKFNSILEQMEGNAGELEKAFAIMADTSEMLDARFNTAVENLQIAIGDTLGPMLDELKKKGIEFLEPITAFIEQNPELVGAIGAMALGVAGVTTAVTACAAAVAILNLALGNVEKIAILLGGLAGFAIAMDTITTSASELQSSVKNARKEFESTTGTYERNISDLRELGERIKDLNEQENLTASQQVELAAAVQQWNAQVGENGQLILDQTGHVQDLNDALADNIELAMQQYELSQHEKERTEIIEQYAEAENKLAEAQEYREEVERKLAQAQAEGSETEAAYLMELEEAKAAEREASALKDELGNKYEELSESIKTATQAQEENAAIEEEVVAATKAEEEALKELQEAYEKAFESARSSLEGQREAFENFNTESKTSVQDIAKTLEDQAKGMKEYADLIAEAYQVMQQRDDATGILSYYIEQGPEAAGELKNLVGAFEEGGTALESFNEAVSAFNETETLIATIAEMGASIETGYTEPMQTALETLEELGVQITEVQQGQYEEQQQQADTHRIAMTETTTGTVTDMAKAIDDNAPKVTTAAKTMMETTVNEVKAFLGMDEGGRSALFYTLGMNVDQSIADGIADNAEVIAAALQGAVDGAIGSLDFGELSGVINAKLGEALG